MNPFLRVAARQLASDLRGLPTRVARGEAFAGRAARCISIADLRALAQRTLPRSVFDYVDGAANDERTLAWNRRDLAALELRPRVLVDVSQIDLSTVAVGIPIGVPVIGAPTGLSGLVHPDGEVGLARAFHAAGSIYVLSASSSCSIEEVARLASGPTWLQLYMWRDRGFVKELLERARAAGHLAVVLTVDVPRSSRRERDIRNGFGVPPRITLRNVRDAVARPRWTTRFLRTPRIELANAANRLGADGAASMVRFVDSQFDPAVTWQAVSWLREQWTGRLLIKGILTAEDASRAVGLGIDGIIVSNHGGRQLDEARSSISALPEIAAAAAGQAEIYLDGGVRKGGDILKAIALGARACLVGRAALYGLAAGGGAGASRAIEILTAELQTAMALAGCASVGDLDESWIVRPSTGTAL
jgi:isopentenyl diphosphate isomerase/L-lactate dehydrogenase-like FMN-dependent dehydrogenase